MNAWPDFLPDGDHFLYLASTDSLLNNVSYTLKVGSISSLESKALFNVPSKVEYCEPGYLMYVKDKILLAQAFDVDRLEVVGDPIPVAENVANPPGAAISHFDCSDDGTLVYMTTDASSRNELVWVDRTGAEIEKIGEPGKYGDIALSPDNRMLIYGMENPQSETDDLWMYDITRKVASRFTFSDNNEAGPIWSPDAATIYYCSGTIPQIRTYSKPANGTGTATLVPLEGSPLAIITDMAKDGRTMCVTMLTGSSPDIFLAEVGSDDPPVPVVQTERGEYVGRFSPDGQYLAYLSEESDLNELYIRQLGGGEGRWQISSAGARLFEWSPIGDEIVFVNRDWEFIAVPIKTTGGLEIGAPKRLFERRFSTRGLPIRRFIMTADGQRILLVSDIERAQKPKFQVVLNWPKTIEDR